MLTLEKLPHLSLPAYVLALFDEGDGGEGGGEGGGGTAVITPPAPAPAAAAPAIPAPRATRGREVPASDDPAELRRALESANARISEVNEESKKHRTEARELKTKLGNVETTISLSNQRAIRAEARVALIEEGAIDTDVVDLLLKAAGDKIKIDDKTGDVVGVREAIAEYKAKKPSFFKAVAAITGEPSAEEKAAAEKKAADEKAAAEKKAADEAEAAKKNATAAGASPSGGSGGTSATVGGLPDLRNMSREERKAAVRDYVRGTKRAK